MRAELLSIARQYGQFSELVFVRRFRLQVNVAKLDFRHKVDANSSFRRTPCKASNFRATTS